MRNGRFDECEKLLEEQSKLLSKLENNFKTLKKLPCVVSMHWEQSVLLHRAYLEKGNQQNEDSTRTPEAVMRLQHLSLNPSGKKLKLGL